MENSPSITKNISNLINPSYLLIGGLFLSLYFMPGLLMFLVPMLIVISRKKPSVRTADVSGRPVKKIRDPRRESLAFSLIVLTLLGLFVDVDFDFGDLLMTIFMIGVCTGGFIWFPIAAYLVSRVILFLYDHYTGNTKYRTPTEIPATPAPVPIPISAPDLSLLSPNEQSLVLYMFDAATRGVRIDEMTLILKSNGWVPEDITHGFDLVRTYYPAVLK